MTDRENTKNLIRYTKEMIKDVIDSGKTTGAGITLKNGRTIEVIVREKKE